MSVTTFIALAVVTVIILFYIIHYLHRNDQLPNGIFKDSLDQMKDSANDTYDDYFTSPKSLYSRVVGHENDSNTERAISKAIKKDNMFTTNEQNGNFSNDNLNDAATNSFYLASLYQHNVVSNIFDKRGRMHARTKAAKQYQKALNRIVSDPTAVIRNNVEVDEPAVEFIVDRAEAFYTDYQDQLAALDEQMMQEIFFPDIDQIRDQVRGARLNVAANLVPQKSKRKNRKRRKNATHKQVQQDNYYDERDIRSDPQNVHESQVVDDMVNIYRNIITENDQDAMSGARIAYEIKDIRKAINDFEFDDPAKKDRALKILAKISQGNLISKLYAGEDEILLNVWRRIHSPSNAKNCKSMKASLMDSLADGMDKNHRGEYSEVCAGGRTSRVLGSLVLMDTNEDISAPMKTKEIMRNEVFNKAYKIIQDNLENAPKMVANAYNGVIPEEDVPIELQENVKKLEDNMRKEIADSIRNDYPNASADNINDLIKDAQAGV